MEIAPVCCIAGMLMWALPHKAEGDTVNADEAGYGLRLAGPVHGVGICELVCGGPDAEVRIVGDERCCGRLVLSDDT